ncbi:MAG: hypothetical protein F6K42_35715 [Leptolyngbya sp. SIO1D8]|nr:hypothetical protein [Leptolyngbya sp. SIO1D8]
MLPNLKSQDAPDVSASALIPDPWDTPPAGQSVPRAASLDPSHELAAAPTREVIMPQGVPEALRIPQHTGPVRSAVAILLEDELKLAAPVDEHLWKNIRDAIALCLE